MMNHGAADLTVSPSPPTLCSSCHYRQDAAAAADTRAADQVPLPPPVPPPPPNSNSPASDERALAFCDENLEVSHDIYTKKMPILQGGEKDTLTECLTSQADNNTDTFPALVTSFMQEHRLQKVSSFQHADLSSFVAVSTAPGLQEVQGLLTERLSSLSAFTDLRAGTQLRVQEDGERALDNRHVKNKSHMTLDYGQSRTINDDSLHCSSIAFYGGTTEERFCLNSFIPSSQAVNNYVEKRRCVDFRFRSGNKECNFRNQSDVNPIQSHVSKTLSDKNSVGLCNNSSLANVKPLSSLPCEPPINCVDDVERRLTSSQVETVIANEDCIANVAHAAIHETRLVMEGSLLIPSTNCSPLSPHLPLSSGLPGQGSQDSGIASCEPSEEELSLPLNSRRLTMTAVGGSSSDSCQWLGSLEYDAATSDLSAISQSFTSHQLGSCFHGGVESTSVKDCSDTELNFDTKDVKTCCNNVSTRQRCSILCRVQSSTGVFFNDADTESGFSDKEAVDEVNRTSGFDKLCLKQDHLNNVESLDRKNLSELNDAASFVLFECKDSPANSDAGGCQNNLCSSSISPHFASLNSQEVSSEQPTHIDERSNLCKFCNNLSSFVNGKKCICVHANSTSDFIAKLSNPQSHTVSRESVQISEPPLVLKTNSMYLSHRDSPLRCTSGVINHETWCCNSLGHEVTNRHPRNDHIYAKSSISSHISKYASFLSEKIIGQALKKIFIPVNGTMRETPNKCSDEIGSIAHSVNSYDLSASGIALVYRDVNTDFGKVPIESAELLTRTFIENATQKQASRSTIDGDGDIKKYSEKSMCHPLRTQRSLSDTELIIVNNRPVFDMNCPFRSDKNCCVLYASEKFTSLKNKCNHSSISHTLDCCDAVPLSVPNSSQFHYSLTPRKCGSSTCFDPSFNIISNSSTSSPLITESGNSLACQSSKGNRSALLSELHCTCLGIPSPERRVEVQQNVRPCDDMKNESRSSAIGRPVCFSRDARRIRESADDEDYYPRELSTSEYSDKPPRKPAKVNRPFTELYPNSSQKKKRRIRTRRRSSTGRNRASKMLLDSRSGRRSSRSAAVVPDPVEVYSQPVDSIAEATVLQPRVVIASQPRRLSHRKHRITSSALNVALPLLNSSTIAGSKNVPLKSSGSEAFAPCALSKISSPKKGTKEKKNSRKFLCRTQKPRVTCETMETVSSKESIVCNVGSAHRTSLLPSSDLQSQSNLLLKSEICNEKGAPDCEYINLQKSSKRSSRKDKHEHRSLCRLLPFVGMRWCQRKDDHSSESREEAYVASDPVTAITGEDKKRGFFSSIRSGLYSLFSFGSNDKNDVRTSITVQTNVRSCNGTSAGTTNYVDHTTAGPPQLPPTPSDLLNHSSYSAFTRAPARLPLHEPLGNRVANGITGSILATNDGVDKETLEVLAGDAVVSPVLPLISSSATVQGDLGCRSPVGILNQRALPPLPKSEDSVSPPHPPIPPPLPQAVLSAVAVTSNQSAPDTEPMEGLIPPRDGGADAFSAGVAKVGGGEEDGCHFASMIEKVKDYGWYWGPISGKAAEKIVSNEPDGSFIVRDSSDDHYIFSLTFKLNGLTRHVRIEHDQGNFSFGGYTKFKSQTIVEFIESAIEHSRSGRYLFFLHRRPLLGPRRVQLLHPVSRYRHVQSLQHLCRFVIVKNVRRDRLELLPLPGRLLQYLSSPHYYSELVDQLMAEEEEEEGQKETFEMTLNENDAGVERVEESSVPCELETDDGLRVDSDRTDSIEDGVATELDVPGSERKESGARPDDSSSSSSHNTAQDTVPDSVMIPELDDPEDEIGVICNPFECSAVVEALHPFDQSASSASLSNDVHEFCFVHCQDKEQSSLEKPSSCESPILQAKCSCASSGKNAQYNISSFCNRCIVHSPRSICVGGHRLPVKLNHSEEIVLDHEPETFDNRKKLEPCTSFSPGASLSTSCSSSDTAILTTDCDEDQGRSSSKLAKPVKRPLSMSSFLCGVPKSYSAPRKVSKIVSYHVDLNSDGPTLIKFTKLLDGPHAEFSSPQSQITNYVADTVVTQASTGNQTNGCNEDGLTRATGKECLRVCTHEGAGDGNLPSERCDWTDRESNLSPDSAVCGGGEKDSCFHKGTVSENDVITSKDVLPAAPILSVIAKSSLEELGTF
ncbi:SH2 domain [Trinorchestia longiramus]|nr:SH2 domain [Trinorchestia longiramus]